MRLQFYNFYLFRPIILDMDLRSRQRRRSVEGWHCGFQSSLQCSHPTLWKLLDQLIRENELHKLTVVQLLAGQKHKPKRVYRVTNDRIVNVVANYNSRTFVEFLRGVAHNLQL